MKVIALLSGGKDSIYNLHHCILNNHEPVCVASLGPPEGRDELDSFMYQTVAHSGLAILAQALDLPFYSTSIKGKPINQSSEYGSRSHVSDEGDNESASRDEGEEEEEDETEDLYKLLKFVKTEMPEVQAVAAGAILSNYQRVRVEQVCSRLGLASIAYLWERNQKELLNEMVLSGQQSVLVKVAGAGLGVQHLGKSLAEMQPILHKLNEKYETHVCGEGGEYETFTLDSPIFKKRLVLKETETIVSNPDPHSTVAHLYLSRLSLVDKPDYPVDETFSDLRERLQRCIAVPSLLDDESEGLRNSVQRCWENESQSLPSATMSLGLEEDIESTDEEEYGLEPRAEIVDGWLNFSSISVIPSEFTAAPDLTIEDEMTRCFEKLTALLSQHSATLLSLSHLNLLLSPDSMSLFPRLNKIYSTYFGTSPPTRACVAVHFPRDDRARLKLEGVARVGRDEYFGRSALHVQSLSYWGAANIGPYSQAITVGNRSYIAGQISLVPSSLTLPSPADFALEVSLSLQHLRRIVVAAREGRWTGWCEGGIGWIAEGTSKAIWSRRVKAAREGWRYWSDSTESGRNVAPMLFASAAQLPRSASVEWQVTWQTGQVPWSPRDDEDDDSEEEGTAARKPKKPRKTETYAAIVRPSSTLGQHLSWQCSPSDGIAESVVGILGCCIDETERPVFLNSLGDLHSIKIFHRPWLSISAVEQLAHRLFGSSSSNRPPTSFIGSKYIETLEECGQHDVAFLVIGKVLEE